MKRIIYTAIFLSASWLTGCQEAEYLLFNDIARVQMDEEDEIRTSFYYTDASINRDTVYLTVNTIGDPEDRVRHIAMEQISEYDVEYKYDEKGNLIDSVLTEKPNKAVPGVHYVPMDDPGTLSLFLNCDALDIKDPDFPFDLGVLGIPEFGTEFAMNMLKDTKPTTVAELLRISGLSHGTDVWLGNAQTLIQEKKATISTAICTRDDIMIYLISMGLDSEESFKIMENVRKGIVAKGKCDKWPEWKQDMIDHNVPDWYIWSCEKIKYMFPKAHAAAYVMMAWRIAYCKVFYPLAYYAAYFSIRATAFSYELMCQGKEKLEGYMHEYEKRKDELSKKEQDTYKDMRLVQEMYARGFEFLPLDIYKSEPHHFQIVDGKLLPALNTIDGLGDNAAVAIAEAAKDGIFLSKDDFRERTKVSKTTIELMSDLGLFGDMPESNQLSLFDFGA